MPKLSTRLSVLIITFVIGTFAVIGWFYYQQSQKVKIIVPDARKDSLLFNGVSERGGINQATKLGGLTELRKASVKTGDIEIRVWRGFSLDPLEGVVLKRIDEIWTAFHIKTDDYHEAEKATVKRLSPPKSGWESFWKQLVGKEILTLPQSTENDCHIPEIDSIGYVVEINQDKIYRTYSYPEGNGKICSEAKQMQDIGEFIGSEFDTGREKCRTTEWFACMTLRKLHGE